jgi:hypothetical protein
LPLYSTLLLGFLVSRKTDFLCPESFAEALQHAVQALGRFQSAIIFGPDAPDTSLQAVAETVEARMVVILTSKFAEPGRVSARESYSGSSLRPSLQVVCLQLGWDTTGSRMRWHTAEEISEAALQTWEHGHDSQLGVVRPWTDRPG